MYYEGELVRVLSNAAEPNEKARRSFGRVTKKPIYSHGNMIVLVLIDGEDLPRQFDECEVRRPMPLELLALQA